MPCKLCGEVGHNKRTCEKKLVEPVKESKIPTKVVEIEDDREECPICYNHLGDTDVFVTKCGHKFCVGCATQHLCNSTACPMCRSEIVKKPISSGPSHGQQVGDHIYQSAFSDGYYQGQADSLSEAWAADIGSRMIVMVEENIRLKELLRQNNIAF